MTIYLNDTAKECESSISLLGFLQTESLAEARGIAVAVNQSVVPRSDWETYQLKNQDQVMVIRATQGG
ncbi:MULTISPECIES: sulfur carrier protein ThiS [Persicobacter]|uniref:Thiamine biosynthesis protein ThiS n=1 Tax=Persicobacter diffluens TaxID=981 RepID=A0AAN4VYG3_9BACT|nr:sulfur carrier protein ThiS [Persicobacter sp. CCB-QB2]GJM61125.1 hypothetical protein PEDI_16770 [Persicobacter diffluens]